MEEHAHVIACGAAAQTEKVVGTAHFKAKRYADALAAYAKSLSHCAGRLESVTAPATEASSVELLVLAPLPWPQLERLAVVLRSNRAQVCINMGNAEQAIAECDAGLAVPAASSVTPSIYFKLLLRKAKARGMCGDDGAKRMIAQTAERLGHPLKGEWAEWAINGADGESAAPPPTKVQAIIGHMVT